MAHNVFGLGEVAFVRWLVCRKAILPNPCYMKCRLIYDKAQLKRKQKNKKKKNDGK